MHLPIVRFFDDVERRSPFGIGRQPKSSELVVLHKTCTLSPVIYPATFRPRGTLMNFVQNTLLGLYRGVRRTGFLATRPGRVLFEAVYWTYKSMMEGRDVRSLQSYVVAGSTVIDVGANIGFFTVPFARWVGSEGHVISIEPEAVNFDSLRDRVQRLGLSKVVSLVNSAAIEVSGRVRL